MKIRAWFVDKLIKIGIVEKGTNAATKDILDRQFKEF